MNKIISIKSCSNCFFCSEVFHFRGPVDMRCRNVMFKKEDKGWGRKLGDVWNDPIPEWCPLTNEPEIKPIVELINMAKSSYSNKVKMAIDSKNKDIIKVTLSPLTLELPNNIETFNKAKELLDKVGWYSLQTEEKDVKGSLYAKPVKILHSDGKVKSLSEM